MLAHTMEPCHNTILLITRNLNGGLSHTCTYIPLHDMIEHMENIRLKEVISTPGFDN